MTPIVEMKCIKKRFSGVLALDDISFNLYPGEVHILIGENGAGKSTLMKILCGLYEPTEGKIVIDGKEHDRLTTRSAIEFGISIIYQELSVIDTLSIAENLFVGKLPSKKAKGFLDKKGMLSRSKEAMAKVGLEKLNPKTLVSSLSLSQKQLVEIAKSLTANARIIIMDEPTSSLNNTEVELLFRVIRELKSAGVAIIYISHRLQELKFIGDRITILKDGRTVLTDDIKNMTEDDIVTNMVGRELSGQYFNKDMSSITDECIFEVRGLTRADKKVRNISFKLNKGEILGFSGLIGSGRTELMDAIFGVAKTESGEVLMNNECVGTRSPYHSIKDGIGMITESRRETGFLKNFEIYKNMVMAKSSKISRAGGLIGLVRSKEEREEAERYKKELNLRCSSIDQMITELSGGNQQKVIIGKWLDADSRLLIFDEPTKGIDVGSKNEIYRIMRQLANQGKGILMVSSDLPELLLVCDRIIVLSEGEIRGEFDAYNATEEGIMALELQQGGGNA